MIKVSIVDDVLTTAIQDDVVSVQVTPDVMYIERFAGISLDADDLSVTDDGDGTVYIG